jgi:double-stranded uracil-DNA glycosylase
VVLPDVLVPNLRIVFCGVAAGEESARRGVYYAGRGNGFWSVLAEVGLTPTVLRPEEFPDLLQYGIGLTDLAKKAYGNDVVIRRSDFDRDALREKIEVYAPAILALNGKKAAEAFLGRKVEYGIQSKTIGGTRVFALPSTSGNARAYWDVDYWHELARRARKLTSCS